jgi:ribosome biogenesis protein MAK21
MKATMPGAEDDLGISDISDDDSEDEEDEDENEDEEEVDDDEEDSDEEDSDEDEDSEDQLEGSGVSSIDEDASAVDSGFDEEISPPAKRKSKTKTKSKSKIKRAPSPQSDSDFPDFASEEEALLSFDEAPNEVLEAEPSADDEEDPEAKAKADLVKSEGRR